MFIQIEKKKKSIVFGRDWSILLLITCIERLVLKHNGHVGSIFKPLSLLIEIDELMLLNPLIHFM